MENDSVRFSGRDQLLRHLGCDPPPAHDFMIAQVKGRGGQAISQKLSLGEKFWEIGRGAGAG